MSDPILARSTRGQTLRNKFESQKPRLSYIDYHYEDVKARLGNAASPSDQTRKVGNRDEIVRHMSNLPSFLETRKDRVLNFGVMDWGKLQKWQYQQHLDSCSPCSSNSSPLVSTGWSTPRSTKSQRGHPAGQSPYRLTLQSHFNKLQESESSIDTRDCTSNSASLKGKMKIQDAFGRTRDFNRIERRTSHRNSETDEENRLYQVNNTFKEKRSSFSSKTFDLSTRSKSPIRRFSFSNTKRTESPVSHVSSHSHSSPLRRLFEPLLKATNTRHTTENPRKDSEIHTSLNFASGHYKCESTSTRRALFGSAVKNGLPLFTFATEDNSNILAANVQDLTSSGKDNSNRWIYTIYTVDEIKKKNGSWLSSTRKDKGHASHAYASNVTAQMSVTNRSVYSSNTREFSLFRMDPFDELAAIVVKFPRNMEAEEPFSTTVILPGGNHGGSSDSKPSSLTDRWRSGGVCDCGGWDLGCRLRTLTTQVQSSGRSNSPNGQFQLFFQGDVMNKNCFFKFSPVKQGMSSVEYDSSVSSLQAFSICISVVECRKSSGHQESATYVATQVKNGPKPGRFASFPPLSPVGRV